MRLKSCCFCLTIKSPQSRTASTVLTNFAGLNFDKYLCLDRLVYKRKEVNTYQEQSDVDGGFSDNSEVHTVKTFTVDVYSCSCKGAV